MDTTTTRVYRDGLLPPTLGGEKVSEQMRLAHRYQNTLIQIERRRREATRAVLGAHADVEPLEAQVARLLEQQQAVRQAIGATRAETRTRAIAPELKATADRLRTEIREARAQVKAAKQALRDDPEIQQALAAANEAAKAEAKAARATCGVYWGTYLQVEQAMDVARKSLTDPRFRRWTGDGTVAVQLQGGLDVEALLSCEYSRA